jgi:putative transposase
MTRDLRPTWSNATSSPRRPVGCGSADVAYIPTSAGFLYLAVVPDTFSRRIVGWATETHLSTELELQALNLALWQSRPAAVIRHLDHGSQYTSIAFGQRCRE